ncbi:hypothetical protein [Phenylobacterium sp.]|jgi:hypothetical protein|uniref:hypothetical protein n=1 Tax=Phenylobacterium sp. TaxID=1871053 RepID=UPI002F3E5D0A
MATSAAERFAVEAASADALAMAKPDSAVDRDLLAYARALLTPPPKRERVWPALAAAGLLAVSSLVFAVAMVTAPPLHTEHAIRDAVE